ncbi:SDR family oxidoreductase [Lyngbya sp. CCY1209]|jgi:NADP-dependent 3-hydroxy acid dehydrogenase YdfG|uniref:SDR family oxidoreductase n=1 Tax=Lyngbya sp. CCY1209 TaxID=2886103 RepID=UPI002D215821|nr:SDR family oxidoreductase [Lyngbya sp. CCY1209]MEB3881954.1 SDR family oxidoreductase [Lyngbya sp. CCY1209]
MSSPTERRALITGASSGIGKATALALADAGIHIALVSRSPEPLEAVARQARQRDVEAQAFALDLFKIEQVHAEIATLSEAFGPFDILVNSAGMGYTQPLASTPLADWQRVIDLNLTGVFECIKGVLPGMRDKGGGTIVNIVSIGGQQVFPNWGAYCASKFGLMALSRTLAAEERPHGIRVTAICPGAVNTSLWDAPTVEADFDRSAMLNPETVARSVRHAVELPPEATLDELILMPSAGSF